MSSTELSPPTSQVAGRSPMWPLIAVSLATFMTYLDNNIINVAIPTIQRDLHLSQSGMEWVVSAYILVFAGLLLAGGRLADLFGARRLFTAGLALFTGASLLAGLAGHMDVLVASRALQGLGAALLTPATLSIISATFRNPAERARAVGIWSAVGALALAFGPLLGGLLSQDVSWHWIFFINVPIGVATLVFAAWAVPADGGRKRDGLDVGGLIGSSAALGGLTFALIQGPQLGWTAGPVLIGGLVAAVGAAGFVAVERRTAHPMVDLGIFTNRVFAGGVTAQMLWAFGLFGIYFYTSLYLQNILHFGPMEAGAAFVPMALLMAVGASVSDRVAARFGAHRSVGWAMALMGAGIASVSLLGPHATFLELMPGLAVIGVGGGLTIPLTATILGVMSADRAGVASGLFNSTREVAGLLGVTLIGVILTARMHAQTHLGRSPQAAFLSGYRLSLVIAGAMVAAGGLAAWRSLRTATSPAPTDTADAAVALELDLGLEIEVAGSLETVD
jgi:EmrB/QacA subfamily drug resistance transporter